MSWAPPASGGAAAPPAGGKDPAAEAKLQQYLRDVSCAGYVRVETLKSTSAYLSPLSPLFSL